MQPQLKDVAWERTGDELRVLYDRREELMISDPDGMVDRLLGLLSAGGRTIDELADALDLPADDVGAALESFDACGLLEDGDRLGGLTADDTERYFSNLAFFEMFGSLARSREDIQATLRRSHVLVLGTGGLNSNTIPHLCGLGVGRLTLLDRDVVDPRNFARQYLYKWEMRGARKVERAADWVHDFDPSIEVETIDGAIDGVEGLDSLLERLRPDAVMSGVDRPIEVDDWVNAACVAHRVPYVRGGMQDTAGMVWSIDPGNSGCWACRPDATNNDGTTSLQSRRAGSNRGIGPIAGLLGSLCAFEVLRYLTRFEPPAYASSPVFVDFADGCAMTRRKDWERDPECSVCADPAIETSAGLQGAGGRLVGSDGR